MMAATVFNDHELEIGKVVLPFFISLLRFFSTMSSFLLSHVRLLSAACFVFISIPISNII